MHRSYCPLSKPGLTKAEKKTLPCLCRQPVRKLGPGLYVFTARKRVW